MAQEKEFQIQNIEESQNFVILDVEKAESILHLDDVEFAKQVIGQYLDKSEKGIAEIDATVRRKKTSETYQIAHDLVNSSLYIGTERMAAICTFIYINAKKRNIPPLKDAVETLRKCFEESKNQIEEILQNAVIHSK